MENEKKILSDTYEILGVLGSGSGGIVYKAYHKRLQKEVVLKKMISKNINVNTNRQEADILKHLNHMYLPQVLDFLEVDDDIYTVMSFIPGESFKDLLKRGVKFSQRDLIRWGMQLCSALYYLHTQNPPIIHSDIKPANIMLTPQGNICLIDFNISFFMDDSTVLGYSDGYTSPEQYIIALDKKSLHSIPNHKSIDEKSDIYSVGATFFHLATGRKLGKRISKDDEMLLVENTSEAFAAVIMKALQNDSQKRYRNALEMFQAFQGISKKDKRYRRLIHRQWIIRGALVCILSLSIIGCGYGVHLIKLEKLEKYNSIVEKQTDSRIEGDYEEEENLHKSAIEVYPSGLETYYQNACALYQQQRYRDCISFIDYDILKNEKLDLLNTRMADIYYLKAESYFELEEYQNAIDSFEHVFEYGGFVSEYYRDYAIALAYNGQIKRAEEVLNDAIEYGLENDSVYFAKGEIEHSEAKMNEALTEFRQCIEITENEELKTRAYVLLSKIYEEQGDILQERTVLLEAKSNLSAENQMLILERLIQADINLAENAGQTGLRDEAIQLLYEVIDRGWDIYDTYDNLAILFQKQKNQTEARNVLNKMIQMFGEDYNIDKRFAFLEIEEQEVLDNMSRDYSEFARYYKMAEKLYYEQLKDNNTDVEMGLLENIYQQVKSGGWL